MNNFKFYLVWWEVRPEKFVLTAIETSYSEATRTRGDATSRDRITGSDYLPTFAGALFEHSRAIENLHGRVLA